MPDFWLDADAMINPHRGPYTFERVPQFWAFLEQQARDGVIGSPELILDKELTHSDPTKADNLERWAKPLRGVLFHQPDQTAQGRYAEIIEWVQTCGRFKQHHIAAFLDDCDPWVVACAAAGGGRVVTFEVPQPQAKAPKVPDVAQQFGVQCISTWQMLDELGFRL